MDKAIVIKAKEMHDSGMTYKAIAHELGVCQSTMYQSILSYTAGTLSSRSVEAQKAKYNKACALYADLRSWKMVADAMNVPIPTLNVWKRKFRSIA